MLQLKYVLYVFWRQFIPIHLANLPKIFNLVSIYIMEIHLTNWVVLGLEEGRYLHDNRGRTDKELANKLVIRTFLSFELADSF